VLGDTESDTGSSIGLILKLISLLILLFFSAFFSGSETAFFSLSDFQRGRFRKEGSRTAGLIISLLSHPRKLLVSILIGNMIVNILSSSIAAEMMWDLLGNSGVLISSIAMTFVILLLGEVTPKTLAVHNPELFSRKAAFPIYIFSRAIFPVRDLFAWMAELTLSLSLKERGLPGISRGELRTLLNVMHKGGSLSGFEKELMDRILMLDQITVREVMTPRTEVFSLEQSCLIPEAKRKLKGVGYTKFPVYEDSPDNITGVVSSKDVLSALSAGREGTLSDIMRPAIFVPDSINLVQLLRTFKEHGENLMIAIDEYGSPAGVVAFDDLVEEIIGLILDRKYLRKLHYEKLGDNAIRASARMELEFFNSIFDAGLEDKDFETLGGFVIGRLGRIPREGETFRIGELTFKVTKAAKNRIDELEVRKVKG